MYNQWTMQQMMSIQQQAAQQQSAALAMMPPQHQKRGTDSGSGSDSGHDDDDDEDERTLFCANFDDRVAEELLYELFAQAGPIESVRIPKDASGKKRTFGFVTYVHRCSAPYALELLQGVALFRKPLTIKFQGKQAPQRRSLPAPQQTQPTFAEELEAFKRRSFDNLCLRGYNGGHGEPMQGSPTGGNPFMQPEPNSWVRGRAAGGRRDSEHVIKQSSRQHRNLPYQRQPQARNQHRNSGGGGGGSGGGGNKDRRSEQRNRKRI